MKIDEFVDKWKEWKNKDIKELNLTEEEYVIYNEFMEFIYNLMCENDAETYFNIPKIIFDQLK